MPLYGYRLHRLAGRHAAHDKNRMKASRPLIAALSFYFVVALPACGGTITGEAATGLVFPSYPRTDGGPDALISGRLIAQEGCLFGYLRPDVPRVLFIWPDDYGLVSDSQGTAIAADDGDILVHVGDYVYAGGAGSSDEATLEVVKEAIPEQCTKDGHWFVSSIRKAPAPAPVQT